jgi:CBS domain-containing protein
MRVSEVMTRDVWVARPDQSIQEAARMMADVDAGVMPVGEGDRLVGMITDRDIAVRAVAETRPAPARHFSKLGDTGGRGHLCEVLVQYGF